MVQAVSICLDNCDRSSIWTLNPMLFCKNRILMSCCNMSWILMKILMNMFQSSATAWRNSVMCALGVKRRMILAMQSGWEEADLWQGNTLGCSPTEKPCSHRLPPTLQPGSCPFVSLLWGNIKRLWCLQLMWRMPSWQLHKNNPHVFGAPTQVESRFPTVLAEFCQVNVMVAFYGTKIWWSFSKAAAWTRPRMKPTRQCCAQPKVIVWCLCTSMTFSLWPLGRRS